MQASRLAVGILFFAVARSAAVAETRAAASCALADVQAAVNAARTGDTVELPAGTATWKSSLSIEKGIHLKGAGAGGSRGSSRTSLQINVTRTGIRFKSGTATYGEHLNLHGRAGGKPVQIHDCWFTLDGNIGRGIMVYVNRGIVYRSSFDGGLERGVPPFVHTGITLKMGEEANRSWTTPDTMGAKDATGLSNFYVEDCYFAGAQTFDFDDNSRTVVRHSIFNNSNVATHGAETSQQGLRHFELYDNTFLFDDLGEDTLNLCRWIWIRGGTGIIADNAMPDIKSGMWGDSTEIVMIAISLRRKCLYAGHPYPVPRQVGQGHDGSGYIRDPLSIWNNAGDPHPLRETSPPPLPPPPLSADEPFLHPLFTDHMVLQRDAATAVWGWTQPGKEVTVALAGKTATGTADARGKWRVRLGALPAGGPHTMTVTGPQTAEVRDVLLGDVWICSGQSNMQMSVGASLNARAEIAAATHPRIRFFGVPWAGLRPGGPQVMHTEPQETVAARWEVCSPETVGGFSAVGYFFARDLQQAVDVPIGLIRAAVGGSPITSWCSASILRGVSELKAGLESVDTLRALIREDKIGDAYFKGVVERWWEENDAGTHEGWFKPECETTGWGRVTLSAEGGKPDLPPFDGIVWFRKEVGLPPDWTAKELSLYITGIWEPDTTWFNGTVVGEFGQGWINRTSRVPAALVKAGRNVIAVRVLAQPGRGYQGPSAASKIELSGGDPAAALSLGGERFLRESTPAAKLPPFPHRLDDDFQLPTVLFNGMIAPLLPFAIKGVLWYQGETSCPGGHAVHRRLLTDMIADWREGFGSPDSWFLIVQIPVLGGMPTTNPDATGTAEIRAVQWDVGHSIRNGDTAVITDLGDPSDIHPKNKQDVGKRLARIALARILGKTVEYSGPVFESATVEGRTVRVRYHHLGGGLVVRGDKLGGFALAGADRRYVWADAKIDGDDVLVLSPLAEEPKFLRYDYVDVPTFCLWNKAGLPAAPFDARIGP